MVECSNKDVVLCNKELLELKLASKKMSKFGFLDLIRVSCVVLFLLFLPQFSNWVTKYGRAGFNLGSGLSKGLCFPNTLTPCLIVYARFLI